jgi:BirA family biotin operon repressor/biotin-[acetyl-CoA-carboxylase] ligase
MAALFKEEGAGFEPLTWLNGEGEGSSCLPPQVGGEELASFWRLEAYDQVESTNKLVKQALLHGENEGLVVAAASQTGGYGRQGKTWSSPSGGVYFSCVLRPGAHGVSSDTWSTLSLVVACALREALAGLADARWAYDIVLKWPNDVVVNGSAWEYEQAERGDTSIVGLQKESCTSAPFGKLAGISLEACGGGLCLGVGINVQPSEGAQLRSQQLQSQSLRSRPVGQHILPQSEQVQPSAFRSNTPAYLEYLAPTSKRPLQQEVVQAQALETFHAAYTLWCHRGLEPFLLYFKKHHMLQGRRVVLLDIYSQQQTEGVVRDLKKDGALVLETKYGQQVFYSGEIHIQEVGSALQ